MRFTLAFVSALVLGCAPSPEPFEVGGNQASVINGTPTTIVGFPFMVSLQVGSSHTCGGTVIADRVVLTAAHCIGSLTRAIVNITDLNALIGPTSIIDVEDQVQHPYWDPSTGQHDIGLVLLETSAVAAGAQLVRLNDDPYWQATPGGPMVPTLPGTNATVVGWGCASDPFTCGIFDPPPPVLQRGRTTIGDWYACEAEMAGLPGALPVFGTQICSHQFSAGHAYICGGDSGGPLLVIDHDGEWRQMGITSWAYFCVGSDYSVFTRLSTYYNQIWNGIEDLWGPDEVPTCCDEPT